MACYPYRGKPNCCQAAQVPCSLNGFNASEPLRDRPMATSEQDETGAGPSPLDLEALAERNPEPPKFIVADWLPCGYATLLAGHGGVGKSGIALHLAVCIAS